MDYENLSDAELDALVVQKVSQPKTQSDNRSLDSLSDDELDEMVMQKLGSAQPESRKTEAALQAFGNQAAQGYLPQLQAMAEGVTDPIFNAFKSDEEKRIDQEFNVQDETYTQRRDRNIERAKSLEEQHPAISTTAAIAGGIAGTVALGAGAGSAATKLATKFPSKFAGAFQKLETLQKSKSFADKLKLAGSAGAISGLIRNPGDTEGEVDLIQAGDRLQNAAIDAGTGLAFQSAVSAIGKGGSRVFGKKPTNATPGNTSATPAGNQTTASSIDDLVDGVDLKDSRVINEFENLKQIAKDNNLPAPTIAQAAGGDAILAEKNLAKTPFFGRGIRKQAEEQVKAVRKNLEEITGTFIDADNKAFDVGDKIKSLAEINVKAQKQVAQELYGQVDQLASASRVQTKGVYNRIRNMAADLGMMKPDGTFEEFNASNGMSKKSYDEVKSAYETIMKGIKRNGGDELHYDALNSIRKTLKSFSDESVGTEAGIHIKKLEKSFNDSFYRALNRANPKAGNALKEANFRYAEYKNMDKYIKKNLGDTLAIENVSKRVWTDTRHIEEMKKIIGEENVREVGIHQVREILKDLGGSGVARADTALKKIYANKAKIVATLGEKEYKALMGNLRYLNRVNEPIDISRASLYSLLSKAEAPQSLYGAVVGGAKGLGSVAGNSYKSGRFNPGGIVPDYVATTARKLNPLSGGLGINALLSSPEQIKKPR